MQKDGQLENASYLPLVPKLHKSESMQLSMFESFKST